MNKVIKCKEKKINAKDLGIDLESKKESELFKWFLACLLFGKPIQQEVAKRTYFEFEKEGLVNPDAILKTPWKRLVAALDKGHYVRYDESTAAKLLEIMKELQTRYITVSNLLRQSDSVKELARRLQEFKGIGLKTTEIFIDELLESGWQFTTHPELTARGI